MRCLLVVVLVLFLSSCGIRLPQAVAPPSSLWAPPSALITPIQPKPVDHSRDLESQKLRDLATEYLVKSQEATTRAIAAEKSEKEAENRAWISWTHWISMIVVPLAIAFGAVGMYFGVTKLVLPICIGVIAFAIGLQVWAQAQVYLLYGIIALAFIGVAVLGVVLYRNRKALLTTSKIVDTLENSPEATEIIQAKTAAKMAQLKAGMHTFLQKARGK